MKHLKTFENSTKKFDNDFLEPVIKELYNQFKKIGKPKPSHQPWKTIPTDEESVMEHFREVQKEFDENDTELPMVYGVWEELEDSLVNAVDMTLNYDAVVEAFGPRHALTIQGIKERDYGWITRPQDFHANRISESNKNDLIKHYQDLIHDLNNPIILTL